MVRHRHWVSVSPHTPAKGVEGGEENTNMDTQREMTSGRMGSVAVDDGPVTAKAATRETTMKAILQDRYGSYEVLALRDIHNPESGAAQALVRARAAADNPAYTAT